MQPITIGQAIQLAVEHQKAGRLAEAEKIYRQVLVQEPRHHDALHLLGLVAHQVGRHDAAIELILKAIALHPKIALFHSNLGEVYRHLNCGNEAVAAYRRAIELQPNYAEAYSNLGNILRDMARLDESIAACQKAIELDFNLPAAHNNLANALKDDGRLDEALAAYRQTMVFWPDDARIHSNYVYALHNHPAYDRAALYAEHRAWNQRHAEPLRNFIPPHNNLADVNRRLKIGYISPDLRMHPIGRFLIPLLEQHDDGGFEIFCYADVRVEDEITQRLRTVTDVWRNTVNLSDAELARVIGDDGIDILVDLSMHMAYNRMLVFARKPAPVQVTYLAYCSTTGMDAIDYRITDPWLDPPEFGDAHYSEQSVRLPETYWCYQPPVQTPDVNTLPAIASGQITFGCLNNFNKVTNETLMTWCRLLCAVPRSRLLVHAKEGSHRQRVIELMQRHGVDPQRVRFVGYLETEPYFRVYQEIDIGLDPFPCAGGTTTCDALWMGVPVVTLGGNTAVGRAGVSILTNVGLRELIANSQDQYVHLAATLSADLSGLVNLRETLRQRMIQSPLTDAPRFTRHLESAYRQMWRRWCEKRSGGAKNS